MPQALSSQVLDVAIAGTRTAPVTAHSIASIHRLAPGRTFLGIGAGNTALRLMGHRPLGVAEFGEYLRVVRALLDGDEVDFSFRGRTAPIPVARCSSERAGNYHLVLPSTRA